MEYIAVDRSPEGTPLAFEQNGRTWRIAHSFRWYERVNWWETETRMRQGTGRIDIEIWQVQARLGRNPRSPLVTFELVCGLDRVRWWIRSKTAVAA